MVFWQQWYVDVIMKAVEIMEKKGINIRMIWSLAQKEEGFKFPEYDKDKHWVSNWNP